MSVHPEVRCEQIFILNFFRGVLVSLTRDLLSELKFKFFGAQDKNFGSILCQFSRETLKFTENQIYKIDLLVNVYFPWTLYNILQD